ncbi:MAG: TIGR02281 family clan AA aspartic protease [Pseudomonadota bacterium]
MMAQRETLSFWKRPALTRRAGWSAAAALVALAGLFALGITPLSSPGSSAERPLIAAQDPAAERWESAFTVLDTLPDGEALAAATVRAGQGGHFRLKARVNGRSLPFLVDTGASYVTLNFDDARRAGVRLKRSDFRHAVRTANGVAKAAAVRLRSVQYKSIVIRDVTALVMPRGAMSDMNLLGNSFLSKLKRFEVRRGKLIMR